MLHVLLATAFTCNAAEFAVTIVWGPISRSASFGILQGRTYTNMVHVTDISSDVPLQLVTGGYYVGGYAVVRHC
jgi:hypothetical protein